MLGTGTIDHPSQRLGKSQLLLFSNCVISHVLAVVSQVGARLISHAGSLTNLAKYPASTVQILGAEKALFR